MNKIMTNKDFCNKAIDIAKNYKTLYVMGCFGAPMTANNKKRYCNNHFYNKQAARQRMINKASADTFGFDCVCLIKAILWGWNGNKNHIYGGSNYASTIPDLSISTMTGKTYSSHNSTDFSNIVAGELLYIGTGHIGIYIGNGLAVECTPAWENKVQITAVGNIGAKQGYNTRHWDAHCKANFIDYVVEPVEYNKTIDELAQEVLDGKWGNNPQRKENLIKAGYDYTKVQARVNELVKKKNDPIVYIVKRGDYLSKIGKQYNVSWKVIAKDNNIKGPFYIIRVGQKLIINK